MEFLDNVNDFFTNSIETISNYFTNLTQYQMYAWVAIATGIVLIIASFFL